MATHVLVVLSNPVEDAEEEFNAWYDEVHLTDMLSVPGMTTAQRFVIGPPVLSKKAPVPWRYLALYEVETEDIQATIDAVAAALPSWEVSEAIDRRSTAAYAFTALGEPKKA